MQISASKRMALLIALLASMVMAVVQILLIWSETVSGLPVAAASVIVVFVTVFLLARFLLDNFIFQKINPIYKTIHRLKVSEEELRKETEKADLVEEINREVEDWASDKAREIDQLKEMEQYRKEFLGNVSHEMKTPLFNIQGYVLTLLEGGIDDPAVNRLYLERADKSIGRLINIVNDLDTITRLDTGEMKLKFEDFDIVHLTKEVFELQEMRAQKQGIKLRLKKKQERPVMVHADRHRIQEALINLVVNSIKYGHKNGTTTVDFLDMEDNILMDVSDDGPGIPDADLPRIFERFYRVDKSRSRHQGGTGLGLAIVKHIIEAHCQTINVRSKEGKGTSFAFTLRKGIK